ncbi:MAG: hypothetical protein ABDH28_01360 [Brevinematia bacterium]
MVLGIIQARINSDRFPVKVFARFSDGSVVLERVIKQVLFSKSVDKVVVATNYISFNSIFSFVSENFANVSVISGPDEDVLSRFVKCLDAFDNTDTVVRITADNPLTCPEYIDKAVSLHLQHKADLTHFLGIPLGTGVEVIKADTLYRVSELTLETYDREHVTPYIYKNKDTFKVLEPKALPDFQDLRVTLDTPEDLIRIDEIIKRLNYKLPIFVEDVLEVYPLVVNLTFL